MEGRGKYTGELTNRACYVDTLSDPKGLEFSARNSLYPSGKGERESAL